jgi:dephospho-CoA kinase
MRVYGLTGGIGSGKSTVAAMLRELGAPVIDADALAREVVAPGTDGLAEVARAFGPEVLDASGALDRKKLGAIVFADPAARQRLEGITHPRIAAESARRLAALAAAGEHVAFYEAALLVEKGTHAGLAGLVVVSAPEDAQVARVRARDGATEAEARARLAAQLPLAQKLAAATHVIDNGGDRDATRAQVERLWAAVQAQSSQAE